MGVSPAEIKKGIAAYHAEQAELIKAIKDNGGALTQDEFDNRFGVFVRRPATDEDRKIYPGVKWMDEIRPDNKLWPVTGEAFILGGPYDGSWGKWLELLQLMVALGLVKQKGKKPNIVYFLE